MSPKELSYMVLNLIITGIPSILTSGNAETGTVGDCFKPYYNWNTFNTTKTLENMEKTLWLF